MTIQEFLSRFSKTKASGGQWLVPCPAHEDRNPSLAVKEGPNGSILLKDHGGCSVPSILAAMGLEASALFPEDEKPTPRRIVAEYDYRDESGALLYQAVRFSPKGFSQRRPDGNGGWIYNLQTVRRVVYRLPELDRKNAIVICEGEKDCDAAWRLGIPATCNPMGAGKWDPAYADQLKVAGVARVAIIPDNDDVGASHALTVTASLQKVGIQVRLIRLAGLPDHGDLSDWLTNGGTKDQLLELIKATPPAEKITVPVAVAKVDPRIFKELGDSRYTLAIQPEGILMEVNRLRRSSQELTGELVVRVNGHFPNAKTYGDGILLFGDLNFSSIIARNTRAKLLGERSGDKAADWYGYVEEFATTVIAAERRGKPAEVLAEAEDEDEDSEAWTIDGFPILRQLPQIIFGDAASCKSMFAMYLAGQLAAQGIPVLYADWEFSKADHKKRLARMFQPMPKDLYYIRCDHPLKQETDHLQDIIQKHKIQYVICDSIGFAVEGPAESQEGAAGYFRYLRQLRIGSLSIAHIPKQYDDAREAQIFGSIYFKCGARSVWFIERAKENPHGEIRFGLYHRKHNVGSLLAPQGFKLQFRGERTLVEAIDLKDVEELAAGFPLIDRMKEILIPGPMTIKALAEELNAPVPAIRGVLSKHKSQFLKLGNKIGVSAPKVQDDAAEF